MKQTDLLPTCAELTGILCATYALDVQSVCLHRESGGQVYLVGTDDARYVLKIHRAAFTPNALQAVEILTYLEGHSYPCVRLAPARDGARFFAVDVQDARCIAFLMPYIDGGAVPAAREAGAMGRQIGLLHRLMADYPHTLINRPQSFYTGRYLEMQRAGSFDPGKIAELSAYADALWARLTATPGGFCHGDLHTGNMIFDTNGRFMLLDFDAAGYFTPLFDIALQVDATNFFTYYSDGYIRTRRRLERFYEGYRQYNPLSEAQLAAIPAALALRHFEVIPTVLMCHGMTAMSPDYMEDQYRWLMRWRADDLAFSV